MRWKQCANKHARADEGCFPSHEGDSSRDDGANRHCLIPRRDHRVGNERHAREYDSRQ